MIQLMNNKFHINITFFLIFIHNAHICMFIFSNMANNNNKCLSMCNAHTHTREFIFATFAYIHTRKDEIGRMKTIVHSLYYIYVC